ncbi:hypothetical protein [Mycoplasmopsis agalactiae]|uniref:Uncharacterized protein n=1 Tax=Mycoplasmopsis agalactiae TaxID=2110 RepID=D3VRE3_MYCAA|nr:hypothetical protein [Mycoplasmopsis agalactiae]KAB6718619.1 hypothetical protein E4L58_01790 [Mycoplasmopsis agalactiae]CBH40890.1 Hypothetical protein MAGa6870 [Mycoplasmopsis agalactiae]
MEKFSKLRTYGTVLIVFISLSLAGAILDLAFIGAGFSFTKLFSIFSFPIFVIVIVFLSMIVHQTPIEKEFAKSRKLLLVSVILIPILAFLQYIFQLAIIPTLLISTFSGNVKPFIINLLVSLAFWTLIVAFYSVSIAHTKNLRKAYAERIKLLTSAQPAMNNSMQQAM